MSSRARQYQHLQPRELEAVKLVGLCWSNKAIAARMGITEDTVKVYLNRAYYCLGFYELQEYNYRGLAARWSMARALGLPRSSAGHPRTRLLADLLLPPDPPERVALLVPPILWPNDPTWTIYAPSD